MESDLKRRKKLEARIKDTYVQKINQELHKYFQTRSGKYEGVLENWKLLCQLPRTEHSQALGFYEIGKHSMTVAIDLPEREREHTKAHEEVHSYGFHDETITDRIASRPDYKKYSL